MFADMMRDKNVPPIGLEDTIGGVFNPAAAATIYFWRLQSMSFPAIIALNNTESGEGKNASGNPKSQSFLSRSR